MAKWTTLVTQHKNIISIIIEDDTHLRCNAAFVWEKILFIELWLIEEHCHIEGEQITMIIQYYFQ